MAGVEVLLEMGKSREVITLNSISLVAAIRSRLVPVMLLNCSHTIPVPGERVPSFYRSGYSAGRDMWMQGRK